jgi:hypothetical protein
MHKLTNGVAKWKHSRLLSVDDRPTELCLDAIIFGNHRVIECLFDEDGSHLTV